MFFAANSHTSYPAVLRAASSLVDYKVTEFRKRSKLVVAEAADRKRWEKIGVRPLMRKSRLAQKAIYAILEGKPVRRQDLGGFYPSCHWLSIGWKRTVFDVLDDTESPVASPSQRDQFTALDCPGAFFLGTLNLVAAEGRTKRFDSK